MKYWWEYVIPVNVPSTFYKEIFDMEPETIQFNTLALILTLLGMGTVYFKNPYVKLTLLAAIVVSFLILLALFAIHADGKFAPEYTLKKGTQWKVLWVEERNGRFFTVLENHKFQGEFRSIKFYSKQPKNFEVVRTIRGWWWNRRGVETKPIDGE